MIKKLLCFSILISLFFVSQSVEGQPNDFQCTPEVLGLLPGAQPCGNGGGINYGNPVTSFGTTLNATNNSLSGSIVTCYSDPAPLNDVWYVFTASESHVEIVLQGVGPTPLTDIYVAIYESLDDDCVGLMPRSCVFRSGAGPETIEFDALTFGVKYYIQIASTNPAGNGSFNFAIRSENVCADCLKNSILQAYPKPMKGAYPPDTTVGFCYSVLGYDEQNGNRLHGIVPLLGSGWDSPTFTVVQNAVSVDSMGQWKWFSNITINGGNESGFFYDVGNDNDPKNNLGDKARFGSIWTFCFTLKTHKKGICDTLSNDLSIKFINYSDGETGAFTTTQNCSGDKDYVFDAHMNCCSKPSGAFLAAATCNNTPNGTINVFGGISSASGYDYDLYNNQGVLLDSVQSSTIPYFNNALTEGNYYLNITDNQQACQTGLSIYVPGPISYTTRQTVFDCGPGNCLNHAEVNITSGGPVQGVVWSNGSTGFTATGLCPGWNFDTIKVSATCTIVDSVFIINAPFSDPQFDYNKTFYCTSDSFAILTDFPPTSGGIFSLVQAPPNVTILFLFCCLASSR